MKLNEAKNILQNHGYLVEYSNSPLSSLFTIKNKSKVELSSYFDDYGGVKYIDKDDFINVVIQGKLSVREITEIFNLFGDDIIDCRINC